MENYNIKIDGISIFNQLMISPGQGDDYTTGSLLDLFYFEENL